MPYDPKQIENTMLKSTYTNKMDMSRMNDSRMPEEEKGDETNKMTASEFKPKDDPMLASVNASVNKSMFNTKDIDMTQS